MKKTILCLGFIFGIFTGANAQWTSITSGTQADLDAIYFKDSLNGFCSGAFTRTLETTDGGKTWKTGSAQGFRDFSFVDDKNAYGASVVSQSMAKTTNGGTSWTSIKPPTSNSLWGVAATSSSTAYFVGTGGVLWKTSNGGASVSTRNSGTTDLLTDIVFTNASTGYIAVQTGEIKKTTNTGLTWSTIHDFDTVILTEMYFVNEQVGYVVGSKGMVAKTTNAGQSWTIQKTNSSGYLQGVNFFDENHGVAVGIGGEIISTSNGGTTWTKENSGTTSHIFDVFMLSPTTAIVIGEDGLILRNDAMSSVHEKPLVQIQAYPNPVLNQLTITADAAIQSIEVFDQLGQEIALTVELRNGTAVVDFQNQLAGAYLVAIETEKGTALEKVVK